MKVKAVIWRPDRTNDVVIMKPSKIVGKTFRHDNVVYFLHADRFQVTWTRSAKNLWQKEYFATYYYVQGTSQPVPVPDFQMLEEFAMKLDPKDGVMKPVTGPDGKPVMTRTFPKVINNGIEGEELASIFNPWFYRTIAPTSATTRERVMFILLLAAVCVSVYAAWSVGQLPDENQIAAKVMERMNAPPPPAQGL